MRLKRYESFYPESRMNCRMIRSGKGEGKCMYKIAVLGDYDSIFGFAALGLDTFAVQTREEAAEKLHQLAQGGYGIIYITEKLAAELTHEIEKYQEQVTPAIIQIPGIAGNTGAGVAGVKKSVEQAVGSDIIFGS